MRSVIAVTSEIPWPLDSGGHLRTYHLLRAVAARMAVRLVTPAAHDRAHDGRRALEDTGLEPHLVPMPPRNVAHESAKVVGAALRREPYVLYARHRRRSVSRLLERELARHRADALYLDHLDALVYAHDGGDIPIVLDMHNVYSRIASRAAAETGGLRRLYLEGQARLLQRMEQRAMRIAHTVFAVSDEESRYFRDLGAKRVVLVPNGVDCATFASLPITARPGPPTIVYVGALSWPPNASAARFLATEVLPAVQQRLPAARLVIVGKDPSQEVLALARPDNQVTVAANVADVTPYYRDAHVLAVPLQTGGGTRLKILEAFAAGVPVVSTAVGCEGLAVRDDEHLVVADRDHFASAIVQLLLDSDRSRDLAERARSFAQARYDWGAIGAVAAEAVAEAGKSRGRSVAQAGQVDRVGPASAESLTSPSRPIRILELRSVRGTGGGPEKTILLGAARTDRSRFAVTVSYIRDARDPVFGIDHRAHELGVDYVEVVERHSFDRSIVAALRRIVRERAIDIVHAHDYKTNLLALLLSRLEAVVPISTAHGWASSSWRERFAYYPIEKRLLSVFPVVVAVSSPIRRELERHGVSRARVRTLLNGIDHLTFRRSRGGDEAAARRALGLDDSHYAIGAVGRLDPKKRFDLLFDAFGPVYERNPLARLFIAGDGPEREALESRAARFPPGVCRLLGHWPNIAQLHHAWNLLVQSSDFEGTPNVVLEAMAFETPIVATRAGGTGEIARDGIDALLVERGNASALTSAIERAMTDPVGALERTQSARRRVEGALSFDARQSALERIYEEAVATRSMADGRQAAVRWA